jgi:hypothetical protein
MIDLVVLSARVLAVRDVLVLLLAREAERTREPEACFQEMSAAIDRRVHGNIDHGDLTDGAIRVQEELQRQVDWMLGAARTIVKKERDS